MKARNRIVYCGLLLAVGLLVSFQLFVPPILGLADNYDFRRTIGTFGYGPAEKNVNWVFVEHYYVPDPSYFVPGYEILTSEYLFIAPVVWTAQLLHLSRIPITAFGLIHFAAFLLVFSHLFYVTRNMRACYLIWAVSAFILTDVAYVVYWNSAFSEPASCVFFIWLMAETIEMCDRQILNLRGILRWAAAATVFLLAKPQNAALGIPLGVFLALRAHRTPKYTTRLMAYVVGAALCATAAFSFLTLKQPPKRDTSYNMLFLSLLPESRNPLEDLQALGLSPDLVRFKGTGAWDSHSGLLQLSVLNELDDKLSPIDIARFYALRPTRLWRHIATLLPASFSLRPEDCGNYERSAGHPRLTRSYTVSLWSALHQSVPGWLARILIIGLACFPIAALTFRPRFGLLNRVWLDLAILLCVCCLLSFLIAAFGDANEPIKHQFLFNLLLDSCFVFGVSAAFARFRPGDASAAMK